jgi:hypothetical protein
MRDPENIPAPADIEPRRVAIYADLVYRNIEGFIANSFPVLRKVTTDSDWHLMLRDYVKRHVSHTPYFPKMPLEFLTYLEKERNDIETPEFYFELAHYEWIETSIALDQREISFSGIEQEGDLLKGIPQLSPLIMPLAYQWPVHRISPEYIPQELPEQPTYLLVYRDRDYEMGFLELNPVSAKLIEELTKNSDKSGKQILELIARQLKHPNPEIVIKGGLEIMQDFKNRDIVLGTLI